MEFINLQYLSLDTIISIIMGHFGTNSCTLSSIMTKKGNSYQTWKCFNHITPT